MRFKKILIYYEQRGYGGVDTHMAHLINNWPAVEDHFLILTNEDNEGLDFLKSKLRRPKVELNTISFGNKNSYQGPFLKTFYYLWNKTIVFMFRFALILQKCKPDVLISNNGGYPGALTCFLTALIGGLMLPRTFLLLHHAPTQSGKLSGCYTNILASLVQFFKIPLITVSQASKLALESKTPLKNLKVIYNGVENRESTANKINLRESYGISNSRLVIGIISPIDPHKGHDVIIESFHRSKLLKEKTHLLLVGRGQQRLVETLGQKIKERGMSKFITFTGFVHGEPADIIEQFDILAMPTTDFEGFGYSLAEAMALGIPVVASRVGAIPEIITDGENGVLVEPKEAEPLRKALENLAGKPEYRKKIGEAGKKRIKSHFPAGKMAQEYYNLIFT